MYGRHSTPMQSFGIGGFSRPPRDVVVLLAVLFATYAFQFFASTAWISGLLQLSPAVWQAGFVWQLVTYAFAGFGPASAWFLLELLILYWFGTDVYWQLGRRGFWRLVLAGAGGAAAAAVLVQLVAVAGGFATGLPFQLIQGQRVLMVLLIAAFAARNGDAQILLFFVLPIRARWFLALEIAIGFIAFLGSRDLAGFAGICAATGLGAWLAAPRWTSGAVRELWLRGRRRRLEQRLDRIRRQRHLRLLDDDDDTPTIH